MSSFSLNRRQFLGATGKGLVLATLFSSLPSGWVGSTHAIDAPETAQMKFGIIALTDCSPVCPGHLEFLSARQASNAFTTFPATSVSRKSRPPNRNVSFSWSKPSRWRMVA